MTEIPSSLPAAEDAQTQTSSATAGDEGLSPEMGEHDFFLLLPSRANRS